MDMKDYRARIDEIDEQLVKLFCERMETARDIANYKKENNMPILDAGREKEKLASVCAMAPDVLKDYTARLFEQLMKLSRDYQAEL